MSVSSPDGARGNGRDLTPATEGSDHRVLAALRLLEILECFEREQRPLTLQEIARQTSIPVSSAFRLLATLESRGFVQPISTTGAYWLTSRLYNIGRVGVIENPMRRLAVPFMEQLSKRFDEKVNLGALASYRIVYVDTIPPSSYSRLRAVIGGTCYAHASSLGKAILAYLPKEEVTEIIARTGLPRITRRTLVSFEDLWADLALTRSRGYAINDQEMEENLLGLAVPIFSENGNVVGSLCVSGAPQDIARKDQELIVQALLEAGLGISRRFGFVPDPDANPVYASLYSRS